VLLASESASRANDIARSANDIAQLAKEVLFDDGKENVGSSGNEYKHKNKIGENYEMAKRIDKTAIKKRAVKMDDAWKEGADKVEFMGVTQTDLNGQITAVEAKEQSLDDLRAQVKMLEEEILDDYAALDDTLVDVGNGVRGSKAYGDDSPLYGAMGFVRKSERKSGLTRKTKPPTNG
jgi:hypothetical protein